MNHAHPSAQSSSTTYTHPHLTAHHPAPHVAPLHTNMPNGMHTPHIHTNQVGQQSKRQEHTPSLLQSNEQQISESTMHMDQQIIGDANARQVAIVDSAAIRQHRDGYKSSMRGVSSDEQHSNYSIFIEQLQQSEYSYYSHYQEDRGEADSNRTKSSPLPSDYQQHQFNLTELQFQQDQNLQWEQWQQGQPNSDYYHYQYEEQILQEDQVQQEQIYEEEYPIDYQEPEQNRLEGDTLQVIPPLHQPSSSHSQQQQDVAQFIKKYQQVKHNLQIETMLLKQKHLIMKDQFPVELRIRKAKTTQQLITLINQHYLTLLHIAHPKPRKHHQEHPSPSEPNQNASEVEQLKQRDADELTQSSLLELLNYHQDPAQQLKQPLRNAVEQIDIPGVAVRRVMFREDIQIKVYSRDQQVGVIGETEEMNQVLNTTQKQSKCMLLRQQVSLAEPKVHVAQEQVSSGIAVPILSQRFTNMFRRIVTSVHNRQNQATQTATPPEQVVMLHQRVGEQTVGNQQQQDLNSNDVQINEQSAAYLGEIVANKQQHEQSNEIIREIALECPLTQQSPIPYPSAHHLSQQPQNNI